MVTLLADGQLTFALGVAFGLAALRALQLGARPRSALPLAAACALASPVAAVFLAGVVARRRARAGEPPRQPSRAPAVAGARARPRPRSRTSPSPTPGQFPFVFSSFVGDPALVRRRRSSSPAACATRSASCAGCSLGYLLAVDRCSGWSPNAMGGNAVRLGALFGGPVLAAVLLARRPRVAALVRSPSSLAGGLYWQ